MSLPGLINRPATLTRRLPSAERDRYGNEVPGEITSAIVCELQQRTSDEDEDEIAGATHNVYFLPGTPVGNGSAVTVEGETYEIIGRPDHRRNPRTQQVSHIEAVAKIAAGPQDAS